MTIHCHTGLGGRVSAMANALSREPEIEFVWHVNGHCPLPHDAVFPSGTPGVKFIEAPLALMTRWNGRTCDQYESMHSPAIARNAYATILDVMAGSPMPDAPAIAICGRFWRSADADPVALAETAASLANSTGETRVFVFADRHRQTIAARLRQSGITAILPTAGELDTDMSRDPADLMTYLSDWKTMLAAWVVVATPGRTAILHPRRAFGSCILTPYSPPPAQSPLPLS